jgi:hypothetical protein
MRASNRWIWGCAGVTAGLATAAGLTFGSGSGAAADAGAAPAGHAVTQGAHTAGAGGAEGAAAGPPGATGAQSAHAPAAARDVVFAGHTFRIPGSWKVVDLTAHPRTCLRFDVNAVYIGKPGAEEDCPAKGAGVPTGAVLIQPGADDSPTVTTDHAISGTVTSTAPGISVTAAYGTDRSAVLGLLRAAGLAPAGADAIAATPPGASSPSPSPSSPSPSASASASASPLDATGSPTTPASASPGPAVGLRSAVTPATGSANAVIAGSVTQATNSFTGLGFDACTAPSTSQMQAWASSPFQAVGIYIGGVDRACGQPNLTAAWVSQQVAAGWHLMPLYVGLQADKLSSPQSEGVAAADDAVAQAASLGLGPSSVLYYDMESYSSTYTSAVLTFLSAWTAQLHARGYLSAVYSSENSGIHDLVANTSTVTEPDIIDVANWNGQADDDPGATPASLWVGRRVHQFVGNLTATYGAVTIDIDEDYLRLTDVRCEINVSPLSTPLHNSSLTANPQQGCLAWAAQ